MENEKNTENMGYTVYDVEGTYYSIVCNNVTINERGDVLFFMGKGDEKELVASFPYHSIRSVMKK